jgi:hypothetical protein
MPLSLRDPPVFGVLAIVADQAWDTWRTCGDVVFLPHGAGSVRDECDDALAVHSQLLLKAEGTGVALACYPALRLRTGRVLMFLERMDRQGRERQTPGAKGGVGGFPYKFRGVGRFLLISSLFQFLGGRIKQVFWYAGTTLIFIVV